MALAPLALFGLLVLPAAPLGAVQGTGGGGAGVVETIAGPGFCDGPATIEPESLEVGALAVGAGGETFFDTGPNSEGLIGKVERSGASVMRSASPRGMPGRLASDGEGGMLVASDRRIDRITGGGGRGAISAIAGDPVGNEPPASTGDGGALNASRFRSLRGIAGDAGGNLYAADEIEAQPPVVAVRFLNRRAEPVTFFPDTPQQVIVGPGTVQTVVRVSVPPAPGARPAAAQSQASAARSLVALAAAPGRLYVALSPEGRSGRGAVVRMANLGGQPITAHGVTVSPGAIEVVAGGGRATTRLAGRTGADASLASVPGMTTDARDNLYLADQGDHRVYRVDPAGVLSVFAGGAARRPGERGFNGNDRTAVGALLDRPFDVKSGPQGLVYIADQANHQVRFVDQQGAIHAAPGNGSGLSWWCRRAGSGMPDRTSLGLPIAVATDELGNVYARTYDTPQVYRIEPSGRVDVVVGSVLNPCHSPACPSGDGGPPTGARLVGNGTIAARPGGGLYIAEPGRVRFANFGARPVRVHGRTVRARSIDTVATGGLAPAGGASGEPFVPEALAADRRGNLLIADGGAERVIQLDRAGRVSAVAADCCRGTSALGVDGAGNAYVAAARAGRVWFVNRGTQPVTVHGQTVEPGAVKAVGGTGKRGRTDDGRPALETAIDNPVGVAVDDHQNLYLANQGGESGDHSVRKIDAAGMVSTAIGTGSAGFNGDGLKGRLTEVDYPSAVAVDRCGNLVVADQNNQRVRRLDQGRLCAAPAPAVKSRPARARWRTVGPPILASAGVAALGLLVLDRRRKARRPPVAPPAPREPAPASRR